MACMHAFDGGQLNGMHACLSFIVLSTSWTCKPPCMELVVPVLGKYTVFCLLNLVLGNFAQGNSDNPPFTPRPSCLKPNPSKPQQNINE